MDVLELRMWHWLAVKGKNIYKNIENDYDKESSWSAGLLGPARASVNEQDEGNYYI